MRQYIDRLHLLNSKKTSTFDVGDVALLMYCLFGCFDILHCSTLLVFKVQSNLYIMGTQGNLKMCPL